ncbi:MAG: heme biosynthesis HemY N-terminal domain-containing protein [Rickettsiales bacterium]
MFAFFKLILFSIFLYGSYLYFQPYGNIKVEILGYIIESSISFFTICIIIFVLLIAFLSQIVRFLVNLPNEIINYFREFRKKRAVDILHEIILLKEVSRDKEAHSNFLKNYNKLQKSRTNLFDVLNYKFSIAHGSESEKIDKLAKIENYKKIGDMIFDNHILPFYRAQSINDLKSFATRFVQNKEISDLVTCFQKLMSQKYIESRKLAKNLLSRDFVSEDKYNKIVSIICCKEAIYLHEKQDKKFEDRLFESISLDRSNPEVHPAIISMSIGKQLQRKILNFIEKQWKEVPDNHLFHLHLCVQGSPSQGRVLESGEELLEISDSINAKLVVASEFFVYGFTKQGSDIVKKIDKDLYSNQVKKAVFFREALSEEAKIIKISKLRELLFF